MEKRAKKGHVLRVYGTYEVLERWYVEETDNAYVMSEGGTHYAKKSTLEFFYAEGSLDALYKKREELIKSEIALKKEHIRKATEQIEKLEKLLE